MGDYTWLIWGVGAPLALLVLVPLSLSFSINGKYLVYFGATFLAVFGTFWVSLGIERTDSKTCAGEILSKEYGYRFVSISPYAGPVKIPHVIVGVQCHTPESVTFYIKRDNNEVKELEIGDHVQVTYRAESLLGDARRTLIVESMNNSQFPMHSKGVEYIVALVAVLFPLVYLIVTGIRDRRR
jgi:hypothetical protein